MKPQFANKNKNKSKAKKAKKAKAAAAAAGEDVDMVELKEVEEIDYTMPEGGNAKQRMKGKLELKTALKAKVKQLKHSRSKLTKLPGAGATVAKQGAKLLNKEIKKLKQAGKKKATTSAKKEGSTEA